MERKEMLDVLNGMCERCLMKGLLPTLLEAKTLCDTFDRFSQRKYKDDDEYSRYILYFHNLATLLHDKGYTSLEESYSIYNAILSADRIDFVETNETDVSIETIDPVVINIDDKVEKSKVKNKRGKKSKVNDGVVDISDIVV